MKNSDTLFCLSLVCYGVTFVLLENAHIGLGFAWLTWRMGHYMHRDASRESRKEKLAELKQKDKV